MTISFSKIKYEEYFVKFYSVEFIFVENDMKFDVFVEDNKNVLMVTYLNKCIVYKLVQKSFHLASNLFEINTMSLNYRYFI